ELASSGKKAAHLPVIPEWNCVERVGAGATAEVWRAQNRAGVTAAIKIARGAADIPILEREAFRLQQIARRWGADILDASPVRQNDVPAFFLATTWIEGARLDPKKIHAAKRERTAAIVAHAVARALAELHEAGVRHGDVKPDNVLMHAGADIDRAEDRRATLIDLGLATSVEEGARGGTQHYASPELRENPESAGPASDLFALGVMLREILADHESTEILRWIALLTARSPGARPSAAWIADRAAHFLELRSDAREASESRRASVRRVYLSLRHAELAQASRISGDVSGEGRAWLDETIALRKKIHQTPQNKADHDAQKNDVTIGNMSPLMRARFWVALVGTPAAAWPIEDASPENRIVARALELAAAIPIASWTYDDVRGKAEVEHLDPLPTGDELVATIATELGRPRPDARIVAFTENEVAAHRMPQAITLALSDALLRSGDAGRAAYALSTLEGTESDARRAEIARRAGDRESAEKIARRAIANGKGRPRDRARACLARLAWDQGHLEEALQIVSDAHGAAAAEVRALVAYSSGRIGDGLREIDGAQARDVEELARLEAMRGMLEHARGESAASAHAFGRASELATQSGSVVEEATYLTGLAAAATDDGDVGRALNAATRAALLWERLGRDANAARAWLSRASALAALGATHVADEAAYEAGARSEASGDRRAAAYARWARVETRVAGDDVARAEALRAFAELVGGSEEDLGRASARLLIWASGAIDKTAISQADRASSGWSAGARWEWWGARATAIDPRTNPTEARSILTSLAALVGVAAPVGSRGPALAAAVTLATQLGEGDGARRFESERVRASRRLRQHAPAEYRASIETLRWARESETKDTDLAPEQIAQLETIVRAFGGRDRLRPLFEQALDAMLLWAGVERGLLLLRAPDGKLVPRAARNLAREDLTGEQLALSHGIAQQALEKGDAVIATDAFASLGDLHASVHTLRLRSVLAVPLIARGETLGVVYLDDRTRRG
ncbi:MAG: GAF domain-containing protein, partial [Polyangiaceae bacterium]